MSNFIEEDEAKDARYFTGDTRQEPHVHGHELGGCALSIMLALAGVLIGALAWIIL